MRKFLIYFSLILVVLILGAVAWMMYLKYRSLPDYQQITDVRGLTSEVLVYRDSNAIPSIIAQNEADLYRVTGYVMAQDRLWQMDLLRRATSGRLAEIFGDDLIETDLLMRALRIPEKSQLVLSKSDPEIVAALEAFADGVNQFIESHKSKLPFEFFVLGYKPEAWKPEHSLNLIGYISWDLNASWRNEITLYRLIEKLGREKCATLIPDIAAQKTFVHPSFAPDSLSQRISLSMLSASDKLQDLNLGVFEASNNWAVAPSKTKNGKALLCNDMHLGLFAPGIWYQLHQTIPGKLNVTGVALPGSPVIVSGHNDRIAWGMTNVMLDDIDFYLESVNPADSNQYKLDGEWRNMKLKNEVIVSKSGKKVEQTLRFTHRGPVISQLKGFTDKTISMHWLGNEFSNEMRTIYLLNRAANWIDFREAVKTFISISQNIAYADVDGNIGLQTSAGIPIRKEGYIFIQPGDTSEYDWTGLVPFEELPFTYNPPEGFVASANSKTVPDNYPYYISYWYEQSYRTDRIRELLAAGNHDVASMIRIQTDQVSKMAQKYREPLLQVLSNIKTPKTENALKAEQVLNNWDGSYGIESSGACIFDLFFYNFVKNMVSDEMGSELFDQWSKDKISVRNLFENVWNNKSTVWCDIITTPGTTESFNEIVQMSFDETVETLMLRLGPSTENWKWGQLHTLQLKHPLAKVALLDKVFGLSTKKYLCNGSFHTVAPYAYSTASMPFEVTHGASHRHVYEVGNWDASQTIIPTGQSGIPSSNYYCNQTDDYVNFKYHPDCFSTESVFISSKYKQLFRPLR